MGRSLLGEIMSFFISLYIDCDIEGCQNYTLAHTVFERIRQNDKKIARRKILKKHWTRKNGKDLCPKHSTETND